MAAVAVPPAEAKPSAPDARLESLRKELDIARTERDRAREQVRELRSELEAERQAREGAVAEARADERGTATTMLSEGAELRAAVERQREMAYLARDEAVSARDKAVEARDKACAERDEAFAARKQAERDRAQADSERDRANKERDRAFAARDQAVAERAEAVDDRDAAFTERDTIVNLHERGLPIKQPKPRFGPDDKPQSDLEVWMPRGIAIGILVLFAFIVLRLFAG
jgi:uncharacterized protein (DUF3084 family)